MKISLIANSGIQFVERHVLIDEESDDMKKRREFAEIPSDGNVELVIPYRRRDRDELIIKEAINKEAFKGGVIDEEMIHDEFSIPIEEEYIYKINYEEALTIYEETWIPIPYLRAKRLHRRPFIRMDLPLGPECILQRNPYRKKAQYHHIPLFWHLIQGQEASDEAYDLLQPNDADQSGTNSFFLCPDEDGAHHPISTATNWVQDWLIRYL